LAGDAPVVHDTHDLISLRANGNPNLSYFEGMANRGAGGRVYVSEFQRDMASQLYGVDLRSSIVVHNYVARHMIPVEPLPKISQEDGEIHIVYQGGLGNARIHHRYFLPLFREIASKGIHVHIYPSFPNPEYEQEAKQSTYLHYHGPVSPNQIVQEMTQYDYGIVPFVVTEENERHLQSAMPNKLFEYLAAGLSVIARDLYSIRNFIEKYRVGLLYSAVDDIFNNLGALKGVSLRGLRFILEDEIHHLDRLYYDLLENPDEAPQMRRANNEVHKPPCQFLQNMLKKE
jgi:glycosyltransferase involved in cell wall biosynthesis